MLELHVHLELMSETVRAPVLIYISLYKCTVNTVLNCAVYNAAEVLCMHRLVSYEISFFLYPSEVMILAMKLL